MIDRELVTRKLVLAAEDLRRLEALAEKPRDLYVQSEVDETLAERYLERMIGRMIDVNYHLVTESGQAPPRDHYDSFTALGRLGVLDAGFATRLAPFAGLRNRIVHEYDAIEPGRVHDALREAVRDVPTYLDAVQRFLDAAGP